MQSYEITQLITDQFAREEERRYYSGLLLSSASIILDEIIAENDTIGDVNRAFDDIIENGIADRSGKIKELRIMLPEYISNAAQTAKKIFARAADKGVLIGRKTYPLSVLISTKKEGA